MALNPTSSRGGGNAQPVTREMFVATTIGIAAAARTPLTWTKTLGDNLVDLTDPLHPEIITAGVYALSASVKVNGDPATGTYLQIDLELDADNDDADGINTAPIVIGNAAACRVGAAITYYVPAGGVVVALAEHNIVGGSDLTLFARLQRLS